MSNDSQKPLSAGNSADKDRLLRTKLQVPPARETCVPRSRLTRMLNEAIKYKLTLLSAPLGFGKTTLLCEWIDTLTGKLPVAWVSLDQRDNDPFRFWMYVAAAICTLTAHQDEHLYPEADFSQSTLDDIPVRLINSIVADIPFTFALILDDYHVIENQAIHDALHYAIEQMPPQMHMVLSTRIDPPFPLAQWRAYGQLTEIRASALRFSNQETTTFLNQVMGLNLTAKAIAELDSQTEGWIAALQLAALSIRDRDDSQEFIKVFSATHRYIVDYLAEQVLSKLPAEIKSFLLETSILERLTASLCEAVTGQTNGQRMLDQLNKANLFIVPLDDERQWYRYHNLFADLLKAHLEESHTCTVSDLHRRASGWFEQNGFIIEAVNHALEAGEYEQAAQLLERHAFSMLLRGEGVTLSSWINTLPEECLADHLWLQVFDAWALISSGLTDKAARRLQIAEQLLESKLAASGDLDHEVNMQSDKKSMLGLIFTLRAQVANVSNDVNRALEYAHQAQILLPEGDVIKGCVVANFLGSIYYSKYDLTSAAKAYEDAIRLGRAADNIYISGSALASLAKILKLQGRLHEAHALYNQASQWISRQGDQQSKVIGNINLGLGDLLREWNELEKAGQHLAEGMERAKRWVNPSALVFGYAAQARLHMAIGELGSASALLEMADGLIHKYHIFSEMISIVRACQTRLWLANEDWKAVSRWVKDNQINLSDPSDITNEPERIALARLYIAQGHLKQAADLLSSLESSSESGQRFGRLIEILILKALAFHANSDTIPAQKTLQRALHLAEPEGYIRVFLDEGARLESLLLHEAAFQTWKNPPLEAYARKLLGGFGISLSAIPGYIEPLSRRELEVLQLVAEGASNQEIAQQLSVTVSTTKAHLRNINRKLDVSSRSQAVARARSLRLLP